MTHDTQPKRELVGAHRWQDNGTCLIWWKVPLEPGWWQLCAGATAINHTPQTCTGGRTRLLMPSVTGLQVFEQVLIGSGCVYVRWTGRPNCNTHTHTFTWLKQNCECSNRMSSRKTLGELRGTGRLSNRLVGPEKSGWCFIQGKQTMGKMGGQGWLYTLWVVNRCELLTPTVVRISWLAWEWEWSNGGFVGKWTIQWLRIANHDSACVWVCMLCEWRNDYHLFIQPALHSIYIFLLSTCC